MVTIEGLREKIIVIILVIIIPVKLESKRN